MENSAMKIENPESRDTEKILQLETENDMLKFRLNCVTTLGDSLLRRNIELLDLVAMLTEQYNRDVHGLAGRSGVN